MSVLDTIEKDSFIELKPLTSGIGLIEVFDVFLQDKERQQAQIGNMVEFAIALIGKLDGINRHSFNSFRLRVGEWKKNNLLHSLNSARWVCTITQQVSMVTLDTECINAALLP